MSSEAKIPEVPAKPAEGKKETEVEMRARLEAEIREKIRNEQELAAKTGKPAPESGPRYKTLEKCYLKDRLFEEGQEFVWHGAPGHFMRPLNDEAKKKMAEYGLMNSDGSVRDPGSAIDNMTQINAPK